LTIVLRGDGLGSRANTVDFVKAIPVYKEVGVPTC
jgi:hypothetical protein